MLTYAIGDIHGCRQLLEELLDAVDAHAAGRAYRLVCLGDYVDRGPDSAGVVALLRGLQAGRPGRVICLKGNHEDMLLRAVSDAEAERNWLHNGGDAALRSFGVARARDLPGDVLSWIASCPTSFDDGRRLFVHAGLRPGVALTDQLDQDRLWIRQEFLGREHDFGRYVVHGHTPCRSGTPDVGRHRLNLDTGAVFGGRLTAGVFEADSAPAVAFLHASASAGG